MFLIDVYYRYLLQRCMSGFLQGRDAVTINWEESKYGKSQYHYVWLRDNCQCPQCYSPIQNQRHTHPLHLSSALQPVSISQSSTDLSLSIRWPDGHQSCYSAEWLLQHTYDGSTEESRSVKVPFTKDVRGKPLLWGKEVESHLPRVTYQSILDSDEGFLEWSSLVDIYGFCFVDETPLDLESMQALVNRIGLVRNTLWGSYYVLGAGDNRYATGYLFTLCKYHFAVGCCRFTGAMLSLL